MDKFWGLILMLVLMLSGFYSIPRFINYLTSTSTEVGTIEDLEQNEFIDEKNCYIITYNLDGGSANNPAEYTLFTPTFKLRKPTKEGFEFYGWTNEDLKEPTLNVTICQGSSGDIEFTAHYLALLETPTALMSDSVISWNEIENADAYEIAINNNCFNIESTETQIDLIDYKNSLIAGENQIRVRALNNSCIVDISSEFSEPVTFSANQLTIPYVNISDTNIVSWNEIENADKYSVQICNVSTSNIIANFEITEINFDLSQYFNLLAIGEKYWIKVTAISNLWSVLNSQTDWFWYDHVKPQIDLANLSNISEYNKGYFVDEFSDFDSEHKGTLFIQLDDVSGNVWGFAMTDFDIGNEYYSCNAEDITIYQLNKTNNTWSVYTNKYPEQVEFFETTEFKVDDETYFKFINIEESRFDNALYCFNYYFRALFDTVNADRQHRSTSLGFENSYECTEPHNIVLTDGLFSCIQTYSKTTNEVVKIVDYFKLNFTDLGKV